jgi:hypothetical protein
MRFVPPVAMGFPAAAVEGMYRNNLEDVAAFFKRKHSGKFLIWNLSEREYDYSRVDNQVLRWLLFYFVSPWSRGPDL